MQFGRTVYRTLHWAPGNMFCKSSANYNVAFCVSLYFPPKSRPPAPQHYFQGATITVASFLLLRTENLRQINLKLVHVLIQRCFDQIWVGEKKVFFHARATSSILPYFIFKYCCCLNGFHRALNGRAFITGCKR